MNEANKLLRRALEAWDANFQLGGHTQVFAEIRTYLANQETIAKDKPVVVIDDNFGSQQLFKDIAPHSHMIGIKVRYCGEWYWFEGDWLKQVLSKIEFNQIDNMGIKTTLEGHKEIPQETAKDDKHLERLARIMITFDLATGHADTMDDLLDSLESELRDVLGYYREALRNANQQTAKDHPAMQSDRGDWAKTKKPMTQEEIDKGFSQDWFYGSFVEGIRFAEKHHGITEE